MEVGREQCGCVVQQDHDAQVYIIFCPIHKSAPVFYKACKKLRGLIVKMRQPSFSRLEEAELAYREIIKEIMEALAKVEE